jgi:uncharacterized membrane protein (TIGR02234 family)
VSPRRELLLTVGLCLLGSALVLLAVSRAWVSAHTAVAPPLPARTFEQVGSKLAPGARALALVGLAAVAALPATRARGRVVVGVLVAAAGAGIAAVVGRALADPSAALSRAPIAEAHVADVGLGGWPYVALLGALLLIAAGVLVVVRGRRWTSMSSRYDAPTRGPRGEASLWEAFDRGEDPTEEVTERGG